MLFNNNDYVYGGNFGYSMPENNDLGFNGYPPEVNYDGPSISTTLANGFDLAALSTAEIENWWLGSGPEGHPDQYAGNTLLGPSGGELADIYGSQTGQIYGPGSFNTGETYFRLSSAVSTVFNANHSRR